MQQRPRQRHGSRKAVDCENGVHPYEMQLARGGETAGKIKKRADDTVVCEARST